jgi:hypothetical protein
LHPLLVLVTRDCGVNALVHRGQIRVPEARTIDARNTVSAAIHSRWLPTASISCCNAPRISSATCAPSAGALRGSVAPNVSSQNRSCMVSSGVLIEVKHQRDRGCHHRLGRRTT